MKLRSYQDDGINLLRNEFIKGNRKVLFYLPTGGGKSIVFGELTKNVLKNNKKILLVMRRRELVFQAQKNLEKFGIESSIIMGTARGFRPNFPVQICSIDTIHRRINKLQYHFLLNFDFLIVDECHDTTSKTYQSFLENFPKQLMVGFTATPFAIGNKTHTFWDSFVNPSNIKQLTKDGFLVPSKIYVPKKIDVSGIKIVNGDFHQTELFNKVMDMKVIGDVVETYKKYGQNKRAILFAVNKAHSACMAEAFRRSGITAMHQDESHSSKERQIAIDMLHDKQIMVLCNVNIFSTGVDIPYAEIGIMARPTMSEVLYIQQVGRLLRPYKKCSNCGTEYGGDPFCPVCKMNTPIYEKKYATILDHANNVARHGFPDEYREPELKKRKKKKNRDNDPELKIRECPQCYFVCGPKTEKCSECGYIWQKTEREIKEESGELELAQKNKHIEKQIRKNLHLKKIFRWPDGRVEKILFKRFDIDLFPFIEKYKLSRSAINEARKDQLLSATSEFVKTNNDWRTKTIPRHAPFPNTRW